MLKDAVSCTKEHLEHIAESAISQRFCSPLICVPLSSLLPASNSISKKRLLRLFSIERETFMSKIPSGKLIWSLRRYTRDENLWDRVCEQCKQCTPVFEYEHRDEDEGLLFGYLCEACAQKKLASW